MSLLAVYFLVRMMLRLNMGCSALDYRDYRFPCGPQDCSESVTCWNDTSKRPLLNSPTSELASTSGGRLQCVTSGRKGETVLQKRTYNKPRVDFNRTWDDYETGFGKNRNFWIGLKRIHRLTSRGRNILSIGFNNNSSLSEYYHSFWVDGASNQYTMYAGRSRGDSLDASKGRPFTAPDAGTTGCANMAESGWWFGSPCRRTNINLNGRHNATGRDKIFVGSVNVKICRMAIRRTSIHCDKTCPNGGTCRKNNTGDSYVCDCQPRYTGRRCDVPLEDTIMAPAHTTTVKAIPTTTVKAIPTTTTSGSNLSSRYVTSPTTPAPLDVLYDKFPYAVLPVFVAFVFLCAILALRARKTKNKETKKKETNLDTNEETPLVPTSRHKRHKKRRRSNKVTKSNTPNSPPQTGHIFHDLYRLLWNGSDQINDNS